MGRTVCGESEGEKVYKPWRREGNQGMKNKERVELGGKKWMDQTFRAI